MTRARRWPLVANISMLWPDRPLPDRFTSAARAGFDGVEIQFPDEDDPERLRAARDRAGLPVTLVNLPRGGPGRWGLAALPGEEAGFARSLDTGLAIAETLGAGRVNVLAGVPPPDADPAHCRNTLAANLRHAATAGAMLGIAVGIEPISPAAIPGFFLSGLDRALDVLARADHPNLSLQFDLFHMAQTEPDLPAAIARAGAHIGHVQFADLPGRGAPGTGQLDFRAAFAALRATGYAGAVAAEYVPGGDTDAGLGWMAAARARGG